MIYAPLMAVLRFLLLTLLISFSGVELAWAVAWFVEIFPPNKDYLVIVVDTPMAIHDVSCEVSFHNPQGEKLTSVYFFTDNDIRVLPPDKHRKFFRHGIKGISQVKGEFLRYKATLGGVPFTTSRKQKTEDSVENGETKNGVPVSSENIWSDSGITHSELPAEVQ
jgi:hypothetical protein